MFTKVLECPDCRQRFNYEHEGQVFADNITCPECGAEHEYHQFSALIFCAGCRAKLKIPLNILFSPQLACPECGRAILAVNLYAQDTSIASTITANGETQPQAYAPMLQDGEMFDKYRIIRLLGRGGMAEVYLAEHLLLKKMCAVKLMRNGADDPVSGKRFLREAKLSHQFDHPNIVKVFDVGSDSSTGYLFIAMEYIEGKTLHELLKERPLTEEELFDILKAMTHALNALGEAGVVHRDIKPSNIMIDKDGVYKLMDLGIAKSVGSQAEEGTLTLDQSSIGTPNYASPEQCRSAHNTDCRSDIYSLGATLYHLASGRLPFTGETPVETILNVMQTEAVPLKEHRSDLSDKFIDLVALMMKKNPLERPQLPDALLAEIYRVDNGSSGKQKPHAAENKTPARWQLPTEKRGLELVRLLLMVVAACSIIYSTNIHWIKLYKRWSAEPAGRVKVRKFFGTFAGKLRHMKKYPDAAGAMRSKNVLVNKNWQTVYPAVSVTPVPYENLKMCFDSMRLMTDYKSVINGMTTVGEYLAFPEKSFSLSGWEDVFKHRGLTFTEFVVEEFTLSLDLRVPSSGSSCILSMGNIKILIEYDRKLSVVIGENYAKSNLRIPADRWFNLSLVLSGNGRRLALYSGSCLAGVWQLPQKNVCRINAVDFFTYRPLLDKNQNLSQVPLEEIKHAMLKFTGEISRLYLWDKAAEVTYASEQEYQPLQIAYNAGKLSSEWFVKQAEPPAKQQAVPEEKTAQPAAAVDTFVEVGKEKTPATTVGSLEWRMQVCTENLQKLQAASAENTQPQIDYLKQQIAALQNQNLYRSKIADARKQYSVARSREMANELNDLYMIDNQRSYMLERRLFNLLDMQTVDPDTEIAGKPFPVFLAENSGKFSKFKELKKLLDGKYSDGNLIMQYIDANYIKFDYTYWKNNFIRQWYRQGVQDINAHKVFAYLDSKDQKIAPLFGFAESCIKERRFGLRLVDFDPLKELLLLAPNINIKNDINGKNLMHYAAECDDSDLAKILLYSNFAGSRHFDSNGHTPWQTALRSGSSGMVKFLQENNLQANEKREDKLQLKFWQALYKLDLHVIKETLQTTANPYLPNKYGVNALQYACLRNSSELVRLLLAEGVKPEVYIDGFEFDNNPLQIAVRRQNIAIFEQLLNAGAELKNTDKMEFADTVWNLSKEALGHYLVASALKNRWDIEQFKRFFEKISKGASFDINRVFNNYTMLSLACNYNNPNRNISNGERRKIIQYLIQNGARISAEYFNLRPFLQELLLMETAWRNSSKKPVSRRAIEETGSFQEIGTADKIIEISFSVLRNMHFRFRNGKLYTTSKASSQHCAVKNIGSNSYTSWLMRMPLQVTPPEKNYVIGNIEVLSSNRDIIDVSYGRKFGNESRIVWNEKSFEAIDSKSGTATFHLRITFTTDFGTVKRFSTRSTNHRKLKKR